MFPKTELPRHIFCETAEGMFVFSTLHEDVFFVII